MGTSIATEEKVDGAIKVNREPFAMVPFCGYNMADYFAHWLDMRNALGYNAPKIFHVNWYRKDGNNHYLWPGFDENSRVLKWIFQRLSDSGQVVRTPIGFMPPVAGLDLRGVDVSKEDVEKALKVDTTEWTNEMASLKQFLVQLGAPETLKQEVEVIEHRLKEGNNNNNHH